MRKSELTEDQIAKMVIRKKDILSEILIGAVPGYSTIPREELIRMLPGEGDIADMRETVLDAPEEKKVILDTCFDLPAPEGGSGKVIVAIDFQGSCQTAEERDARITMYAAKLMASQMPSGGNRKYSDLSRVHCVWVDLLPPMQERNTIFIGRMVYSNIHGGGSDWIEDPPLLSITRIGLGDNPHVPTGNRLLDILNTLWAGKIGVSERAEELKTEYNIIVNDITVRGLSVMGSLSELFTEHGKKIAETRLAEAMQKLTDKNEKLEVKNEKLEVEKEELKVEKEELEAEKEKLEVKNEKLEIENEALQKELADTLAKLAKYEKRGIKHPAADNRAGGDCRATKHPHRINGNGWSR